MKCFQKPVRAGGIVEGPAADYRKSIDLAVIRSQFVCQNSEIQERVALEFLSNVKPILA
jgi:hypothetical protein